MVIKRERYIDFSRDGDTAEKIKEQLTPEIVLKGGKKTNHKKPSRVDQFLDRSSPAYAMFRDSVRSAVTLHTYEEGIVDFCIYMRNHDLSDLVEKGDKDPKLMARHIYQYVHQRYKKDGRSREKMMHYICAIKKFFSSNFVDLNYIPSFNSLGPKQPAVKDRTWTKQEIKKLLAKADLRLKVAILLLLSSGMRVGALCTLRVGDIAKMQNGCYKITAYKGTAYEYVTFCTAEAAQMLEQYLEFRRLRGEVVAADSPLIRDSFKLGAQRARFLLPDNLANLLRYLYRDCGLRAPQNSDPRKRYEVMCVHGFRKFFNTALINSGVSALYKEKMMGHKQLKDHGVRLDGSYHRDDDDVLFFGNDKLVGYVAALPKLTINDEQELKAELESVKQQAITGEQFKNMYLKMQEENKNRDHVNNITREMLEELERKHQEEINALKAQNEMLMRIAGNSSNNNNNKTEKTKRTTAAASG